MTPLANAIDLFMKACKLSYHDLVEIFTEVDYPEVGRWLSGESGPTARELRSIYDILLRAGFKEATETFERVLNMPAQEAVGNRPWGGTFISFGPTLRHYMVTQLYDALTGSLKTLPPQEQETLIYEFCKKIRDVRGQKTSIGNT